MALRLSWGAHLDSHQDPVIQIENSPPTVPRETKNGGPFFVCYCYTMGAMWPGKDRSWGIHKKVTTNTGPAGKGSTARMKRVPEGFLLAENPREIDPCMREEGGLEPPTV